MKFRIIIEYDPETKSYASYCPELPGCCSAGDTEEEALENAKEAVFLYLEPTPIKLKSGKQVIVPYHKGKQLPLGTLKSIIDGSGISEENFRP